MNTVNTTPKEKRFSLKKEKKAGSIIALSGTLPTEVISAEYDRALKNIGAELSLPGFRKGHIPAHILKKHIGELALFEEAAGLAIEKLVPDIIAEEALPLIALPKVRITKLVPHTPVEYTIEVPVLPEVTLPDYKKLAKKVYTAKKDPTTVTDQELQDALVNVQKTIARWKAQEEKGEPSTTDDAPLVPLNDDDVKKIGNYKDVADFTEKLKQSLTEDKAIKAKDKQRNEVAEAIIQGTTVDVPEVLITDEQERMFHRFRHDIEHMGMQFDTYLSQIKKTAEEIKSEMRDSAVKRATLELAFAKIAQEQKLEVPKDKLEEEVNRYRASTPDIDEHRVRDYLHHIMKNEAVFTFLESQHTLEK